VSPPGKFTWRRRAPSHFTGAVFKPIIGDSRGGHAPAGTEPTDMKTYSLEFRHAASKRKLNALPGNRLEPLKIRLAGDEAAIAWAQVELLDFARHRSGRDFQYVEAAILELLPFGEVIDGKDYRRLGRWVCNAEGLVWRFVGSVPAES
jgi:hypothetical protein